MEESKNEKKIEGVASPPNFARFLCRLFALFIHNHKIQCIITQKGRYCRDLTRSRFFERPARAIPYTMSRLQAHNGKRKSAWKVDISFLFSLRSFLCTFNLVVEHWKFFYSQFYEYVGDANAHGVPTKNRNNTLAWKVTKLARRRVAGSRCLAVRESKNSLHLGARRTHLMHSPSTSLFLQWRIELRYIRARAPHQGTCIVFGRSEVVNKTIHKMPVCRWRRNDTLASGVSLATLVSTFISPVPVLYSHNLYQRLNMDRAIWVM